MENKHFRGNNTVDYWHEKHKRDFDLDGDYEFSTDPINYEYVTKHLLIENQDVFTRKSVLEIGCAAGQTITDIKNGLPDFDCYGSDFSPVSIEAAKKKSPNVEYEVRDIILNPIEKDYGAICILETIEHIEEGTNYKILDNIIDHCEYAIVSTVDTEDDCFGEHISHYKIDTFEKKGYDVVWKSFLSEIQMPDGIYHYMIFLLKGKLN
tara:strand:+ start:17556 stop:18179 length:624 start_codon:yes stop_codon:yes gene_type:complete